MAPVDTAPVQPTVPEAAAIIADAGAHDASVATRVRDLTARVLGTVPDRVLETAGLLPHLGPSSLDLVELIMVVEDAFGIEISDSAAERIATVGDLQAFIRSQAPVTRPPTRA